MSDETKKKKSRKKKSTAKKASEVAVKIDNTALCETEAEDMVIVSDTPQPSIEDTVTVASSNVKESIARDERVHCCICGHSMPKRLAISINNDRYVCSKRCLERYAKARPKF